MNVELVKNNMLVVAFGTRPELLKIEPLLKYWKSIGFNNFGIWLTGQHKELCQDLLQNWEFKNKICIFHDIYQSSEYHVNRLDAIIYSILEAAEYWIRPGNHHSARFGNIDSLLVQGDTASAYACALAAFHRKIPIIHLEAGLRSYDNENPYPEEFYRRSISMMASVNLCPTKENAVNLWVEKAPGTVHVVGNTILDFIRDTIPGKSNKVLCTLHRRENLTQIREWFSALDTLAKRYTEYEFILPIHKNPEIYKYKESFKFVKCIEPLEHNEFINILKDCAAIISDSGGVAEEGSWFKKPIFLCRKETERPEGEDFYIWTKTPEELSKANISFWANDPFFQTLSCPFGDGNSCEKITRTLKELNYI